jgi:peptidoglycan hydrolase-like protein with peptidoglycan-binding domain
MREIKEGKWCADCVGMIKGFFWKDADITATPKYASNNCPDVSANGMIKLCKETGKISTIPDEPGLVVWKDGHIGVYIGGGYTIEMRGFAYDCVKRKVSAGSWTKWGRLPKSMITYTNEPVKEPEPEELKVGSKGEAVKELQEDLLALGYELPKYGADGDYGSETAAAVKAFQRAHGLPVTGVADTMTLAGIETALEEMKETLPTSQVVEVTGGSVNLRSAPGTSGTHILGVAHKGDKLPYQGDAQQVDGRDWYLVTYNGLYVWVSSKYGKLVA